MSRLDIFQRYDYYHVMASKKDLTEKEITFLKFCEDNHEVVCDEDTSDNHKIIQKAEVLFGDIK